MLAAASTAGDDRLREECGVFGVFGNEDAAALTALGLHALQHRGQEAAGIVTYDGAPLPFRAPPRPGRRQLQQGRRDRPAEGPHRARPQPLLHHRRHHPAQRAAAVCRSRHRRLRRRPQRQPHQRADAAARAHLLGRHLPVDLRHRGHPASHRPLAAPAHRRALRRGAAADPGRLRAGLPHQRHADRRARSRSASARWCWAGSARAYVLASETCALDIVGAEFVREIENGEIVTITADGVESHRPFPRRPARPCIFEYIYFARPDSIVGGRNVYDIRKQMGAQLAREAPGQGRRDHPDPGLRRARGHRLRAGERHPLRARHHPQPLRRAAPSSSPSSASASSASSSSTPPTPAPCAATASC